MGFDPRARTPPVTPSVFRLKGITGIRKLQILLLTVLKLKYYGKQQPIAVKAAVTYLL